MVYILYGIFFLSCITLIAAVLLQPGKTDAGALFTSNVSSSAFAPRGTATVLSKVTIVAATSFMLSALLLAMPAIKGNVSVLSANPGDAAPAANSNSADANANTAAPVATDNANTGGLIETPATDVAANKAANAQASNPDPANTAVTKPAAPAANKPAANAPAKPPVKK